MVLCKEETTTEAINEMYHNTMLSFQITLGVQLFVWLSSLYIIFVHNYSRRKQTFVKVIWFLICILEINLAVIDYWLVSIKNSDSVTEQKLNRVNFAIVRLGWLLNFLGPVIHWIFAVEYLKLALRFPLMLRQLQEEEIEARLKRNSNIVLGLNILFYFQMALWTVLLYIYGYNETMTILSSVNPLWPTFLLIFAICRIRSQIKRLNSKDIMAREMLIRVHTCVFITFILVSLVYHMTIYGSFLQGQEQSEQHAPARECRWYMATSSFWIISNILNTAILILFTFMSIKFSKQPRARNHVHLDS